MHRLCTDQTTVLGQWAHTGRRYRTDPYAGHSVGEYAWVDRACSAFHSWSAADAFDAAHLTDKWIEITFDSKLLNPVQSKVADFDSDWKSDWSASTVRARCFWKRPLTRLKNRWIILEFIMMNFRRSLSEFFPLNLSTEASKRCNITTEFQAVTFF